MSANCYKCNSNLLFLTVGTNILRNEECSNCHTDLHCCKMCQFYDSNCYNECKETVAERIVEKEKSNFCDHFRLKSSANGLNTKQSALEAANALFKK